MGTSADDQKGIFRAFKQMFSNNRLLQEEINQLSDRGIATTLVYDAAMKAYDTKSMAKIKKLQEDGKLDPNRVLPVMAKMVQDLEHDSGAYAKMMESSIVKQGQMYNQLSLTSKQIMDSGLDEFLGDVFGQLTKIIIEVGNVAKSIEYLVGVIGKLKQGLDKYSMGNGGIILGFLALLLFRFKAVRLGMLRAFIVMRNGGRVTRVLGELFKGVLGRNLKMLITRFGGWIVVIYLAVKALSYLGEQLKQRDLGNWTIFDTIGLLTEKALLKVKILIAELRWLEAFMKSGAMLDEGFMGTTEMTGNKIQKTYKNSSKALPFLTPIGGATRVAKTVADLVELTGFGKDKELPSGVYNQNETPTKMVFNFFDEKGNIRRTEEHELPATFPR